MIDRPFAVFEGMKDDLVIVVLFDIFRNVIFGFDEIVQFGPEEWVTDVVTQNLLHVTIQKDRVKRIALYLLFWLR